MIAARIRTFLENDRLSFLAQQHAGQKVRTRQKPLEVTPDRVSEIAQAYDPSPNHQYTDWILRQLRPNGSLIHPEDASKVKDRLTEFDRLKKTPRFAGAKDINQYRTYADLAQAVASASEVRSNKDEKKHQAAEGLKLLWERGINQIYEVTTVEAGLSLGWRDTEWCVKDPEYFNEYGPPFFCLMRSGHPAALLHLGSHLQCMNKFDEPMHAFPAFTPIKSSLFAIAAMSPETALALASEIGRRCHELEPVLSKDAYWAYQYTRDIIGDRWHEGEEAIMREPEMARAYATNIIQGRWPEGEAAIATDAVAACYYATEVIHGRWPEAEPVIIQDPGSAYGYANEVIEGRWPEAEETIKKDPEAAALYARDVLKRRWPEAESVILDSIDDLIMYAINFFRRKRWPEGEAAVLKNPEHAMAYALRVIKGRWRAAEAIIARDPEAAYRYAMEVIQGRWPEGEETIAKNTVVAFKYARDIIEDRWPEGEGAINRDPVHKRWHEKLFVRPRRRQRA